MAIGDMWPGVATLWYLLLVTARHCAIPGV